MVVPTTVIFLLFLIAFLMAIWQYYRIDPRRRILNLRFGLMAGAVVAMIYYVLHAKAYPEDQPTSWLFFGLGVLWLACACYLARRLPPRES